MPATQKDPRRRAGGAVVVVLLLCGCGGEGSPGREQLQEEFRRLAEGFDRETGARRISAAELKGRLRQEQAVVLVDTRERPEFDVGHLRGAILLPPAQLADRPPELPEDALVVTYCTAGYRSGLASVELERRLGRNVYSLTGGIIGWFNSGGPIVDKQERTADQVHAYSDEWKKYVIERR